MTTELLVLSHDDVRRLLPMDECIELMEAVLSDLARGRVWLPLRFTVQPPGEQSLMGLMPAHRSEPQRAYGLKAICIFPENPARGLDAHQGGVLLCDGETGQLRALLDASAVTAVRTAAVSAVATRSLAREDAKEFAILGAGVQARSHLEALPHVRAFEKVRIWSRTPEHAQAVAAEARLPVEVAESAEAAVTGADVVVTATSSREPVVERAWLAPGAHVNAVGSSIPTARELDDATMAEAALFCDARESLVNEAGDYLLAGLGPDSIRAELGEVLTGSAEGRRDDEELTVFKSLGLGVEDLAAAEHVYERARAEGVGSAVPF
ncbi:MAG TPA: ornithine cyclodeaminase family protein [Gaiellaceae bacterium]|nr:ornithine cyclodeaminase family protein [Gaiellaceae bacterium]